MPGPLPEKSEPPSPPPDTAAAEQREWRRKMLYHQGIRTDLGNERKYLGWLRVSIGMITLGFVVERLDLFLARASDGTSGGVGTVLQWAPLLIFGLGSVTIGIATWEFFADRRRIAAERRRGSQLLVALVLLTLVLVLLIAVLLWSPGPAS